MNVLMVGPHRKVKGGISTVVNNYYGSKLISAVNLKYVPTMIDSNKSVKFIYGIVAYIRILLILLFFRIDIVHIHMSSRASFYRKSVIVKMGKIFKKKIIIHMHGSDFDVFYHKESNEKQKKIIRQTLSCSDIILALSEEWKEKIKKYCGNTEILVLYNAAIIPESNLYSNNSCYISLMGRLDERKGVYDLIHVIGEICSKYPYLKFKLAGDGDLERLKKNIKSLGIEKNVEVLGWINNEKKFEILKKTLIYLLPSYNEGMPMSIIEAMSYGIPAVTSDVGGIPRLIKHGENGYLIKPGDIEALKKYLFKLISNEALRQKFSEQTYLRAKSLFDINENAKQLVNIYNSLLSSENEVRV